MSEKGKARALKTGIGYQVEQKMEQNYDREEECGTPQKLVEWIQGVMGDECGKCEGTDWKNISAWIRDGVVLCKLLNKLLKADGKAAFSFQKKANSPFVAMTNIENFNKNCQTYGLPEESCFQTNDLWEGTKAGLYNVVNCLHSLGFLANGKNVEPRYTGNIKKDD